MNSITITKPQLQAALRDWEQQFRDGQTMTPQETASKTVEEVAAASVEHLWAALSQ